MKNDFVTRICSIKNHPVKKMDESFRVKYLKGLGACLSNYKDDKKQIEVLYKAWCLSIIDREPDCSWLKAPEMKDISRALALQRNGLRFFTMRKEFFFDCFYLLGTVSPHKCDALYGWLYEEFCSIFTRPLLKKIYAFFKDGINEDVIPKELLEHKKLCDKYHLQKEKRILVVANVSAGKSTLINALVGHRISRAKAMACTSKLCYIYNKPVDDGVLSYSNIRNEYSYTNVVDSVTSDVADRISLKFKSLLGNQKICFIDTPGINNAENVGHRKITEEAIESNAYDAVIYVSNCQYFGTNDEHALLRFLNAKVKRPVLFVLNQLDQFVPEEDSVAEMLDEYKSDLLKLGFEKPVIVPVSAYASFLFKTDTTRLAKIELRKLETLYEVFEHEYYDFPRYIGEQDSKDKLSMTGIISLENKLTII